MTLAKNERKQKDECITVAFYRKCNMKITKKKTSTTLMKFSLKANSVT